MKPAYADALKLVEKVGLKKLSEAGVAEIHAVCKGMTGDRLLDFRSLNFYCQWWSSN